MRTLITGSLSGCMRVHVCVYYRGHPKRTFSVYVHIVVIHIIIIIIVRRSDVSYIYIYVAVVYKYYNSDNNDDDKKAGDDFRLADFAACTS